jgi:hypothetical protein
MSGFHVAQLNVARLLAPLDHPDTAEFVEALNKINELGESSPGFVWRLKDDDGLSSSYVEVPGNTDPMLIVNFTVWEDVESLRAFVYKTAHVDYLRRKREWFEPPAEPSVVCWWIPAATIPTLEEAIERLTTLRSEGPTADAWPLNRPVYHSAAPAT